MHLKATEMALSRANWFVELDANSDSKVDEAEFLVYFAKLWETKGLDEMIKWLSFCEVVAVPKYLGSKVNVFPTLAAIAATNAFSPDLSKANARG